MCIGGDVKLWLKTLYEKLDIESKLGLVEGWKRDGLTDEQIAKNLGVSWNTLKNGKRIKKLL